MKIKLLLLATVAIVQVVSAAHLTVHNTSNSKECAKYVQVWYGKDNNNMQEAEVINPNSKHTFKSGANAFHTIQWSTINCAGQSQCFWAHIPSSMTMLTGKIILDLKGPGTFIINFDKDGASSQKERDMSGNSCNVRN